MQHAAITLERFALLVGDRQTLSHSTLPPPKHLKQSKQTKATFILILAPN